MTTGAGIDAIAFRAEPVLREAGLTPPYRLETITGGGNNRVYRVESAAAAVLLKAYYRDPDDPRDRLRADFGFSALAWEVGARALPRPLASDPAAGMAVYEFIAGRKLAPGEVMVADVAEAAAFFRAVNEHRDAPQAADLPEASEACFSIAAHVACVDRRVACLGGIDATSPLGREAAELVVGRIAPAWRHVREAVRAEAGTEVDEPLAAGDRCLSPSDFGFHNAIRAADGRLRFFDFEYAGRDDPAKMACDFFCQPAVPVPREHLDFFLDLAVAPESRGDHLRRRVHLLMPVYELKWCCIMLNEFLPVGERRRAFAATAGGPDVRMALQLEKVRKKLESFGG